MPDRNSKSEHGLGLERDAVPASSRHPREPLSRTLWGLEWSEHLPIELPGGLVVRASSYDQALPFIREHYAAIFQEDGQSPFSSSRLTDPKERYYRVAGDFFEFAREEQTVGLLVCTPVDWSTYYVRSAATLPEERGTYMVQRLLPWMFERLRASGVERIEADASPGNSISLMGLLRMGFVVSGTTLSERWGALTRLSLILEEECDRVFVRQFCHGVRHGSRGRSPVPPFTQPPERSAP